MNNEQTMNNAFEDFLRKHRRGAAANEAGASLRECLIAAGDTRKKAVLTVQVTVAPKGDDQVEMTVDIKTKLPKVPIAPSMFWVQDGELMTRDPNQLEMNLREVPSIEQIREAASNE